MWSEIQHVAPKMAPVSDKADGVPKPDSVAEKTAADKAPSLPSSSVSNEQTIKEMDALTAQMAKLNVADLIQSGDHAQNQATEVGVLRNMMSLTLLALKNAETNNKLYETRFATMETTIKRLTTEVRLDI